MTYPGKNVHENRCNRLATMRACSGTPTDTSLYFTAKSFDHRFSSALLRASSIAKFEEFSFDGAHRRVLGGLPYSLYASVEKKTRKKNLCTLSCRR